MLVIPVRSVVGGTTFMYQRAKQEKMKNRECFYSLAGSNWEGAKLSHARKILPKESWITVASLESCQYFTIFIKLKEIR